MVADTGERVTLVYEHKTQGRKLVPNGISILNDIEIAIILSGNPDIRTFTKAIKPGVTQVDIYKADLKSSDDKAKAAGGEDAAAKEKVPWRVFFGHDWEGHSFDELLILTPVEANEQKVKADEDSKA